MLEGTVLEGTVLEDVGAGKESLVAQSHKRCLLFAGWTGVDEGLGRAH